MIYIPFFIVILIDKRGDRETIRETIARRYTYDTHNEMYIRYTIRYTIRYRIHITKKGKRPPPPHLAREKR